MHDEFFIKTIQQVKTKKPVLIQGLPGIGNIGKIAVEFMIEKLEAKKVYEVSSSHFPNAVFITENELIELPKIAVYYKKLKNGKELFFLNGDFQPISETSCYHLSEKVMELGRKHHITEIISLGGMGLETVPENPKVYYAATTPATLKKYKAANARSVYGAVGPIMGMAGVLIGVAKEHDVPGVIILAETLAHPSYLGVKGAREVLNVLNTKLGLSININALDREINVIERTMKEKIAKAEKLRTTKGEQPKQGEPATYIG